MANTNFKENIKSPYVYQGHEYFFKVTSPIQHPIMNVEKGDSALINEQIEPKNGDLVLCGTLIEHWNGQSSINGVVVQINRSI
jgi:hypothetical protein